MRILLSAIAFLAISPTSSFSQAQAPATPLALAETSQTPMNCAWEIRIITESEEAQQPVPPRRVCDDEKFVYLDFTGQTDIPFILRAETANPRPEDPRKAVNKRRLGAAGSTIAVEALPPALELHGKGGAVRLIRREAELEPVAMDLSQFNSCSAEPKFLEIVMLTATPPDRGIATWFGETRWPVYEPCSQEILVPNGARIVGEYAGEIVQTDEVHGAWLFLKFSGADLAIDRPTGTEIVKIDVGPHIAPAGPAKPGQSLPNLLSIPGSSMTAILTTADVKRLGARP